MRNVFIMKQANGDSIELTQNMQGYLKYSNALSKESSEKILHTHLSLNRSKYLLEKLEEIVIF